MESRNIAATVHGRCLYEPRGTDRLLIGFHGYAETADINLAELRQIPGIGEWSLAAVQALHPFYIRGDTVVVASWMTRQERELAIADNVAYVRSVIADLPKAGMVVFLGFSQGAAMAYRAAAWSHPAAGVIALGGDVPPDVAADPSVQLPPVLVARGERDTWFTEEKLKKDLKYLQATTTVTSLTFDGGHEWTAEFRNAAGDFLASIERTSPLP